MESKNRIIPGVLVLFFNIFFYYYSFDQLFVSCLFLFMIYDFTYSKIISLKTSIFIIFLLIFSFILFNYFHNIHQFILIIPFLIFLFCFFISKKYINYNFIFLNIINLFLLYEILLIDKRILFLIIFLSFINDTSAFLAGKTIKGPLITPYISPNKTWSGTIFSFLISFSLLVYFQFNILISILISLSFFLGDLFFSYFKRLNSIKDFSNLLQGHGGFLDRFDSVFYAIPLTFIYISFLS